VTLALLLQPGTLAALLVWNFAVLSAAQLTIRLIMAFSVRLTLRAAVALSLSDLPIAAIFDVAAGPRPPLSTRLELAPIPMLLTGVVGFAIARWLLRIRRLRGQVIAGLMVGVLDPHLFTLLFR
jgi:putative effector of murein hydrolase